MSARKYQESSERYGSTWRTVARVHCRTCGVSTSIGVETVGGTLPPNIITKKLQQKGWEIGANDQWDFCPAHSSLAKQERTEPVLKVVDQPSTAATPSPSQQPPRVMDRDDRRIIFARLNDVYLDAKRGYDSGWSDHRVATELGVPRKWVEQIRVENFGDAGTNAEMSEFYEQAQTLIAEGRKALLEAREFYEKAKALMESVPQPQTLTRISDGLGKIEKLADQVKKYVVTG